MAENCHVKRETVHSYREMLTAVTREQNVHLKLMLSLECQRVCQNLLLFCFAIYNKLLNDWSLGEQ